MQDPAKPNYYEILQLQPYANPALVVAAYRILSKLYHPDTAKEQANPEKFRQVQEAYDTLSDPRKREEYDRELRLTGSASGSSWFSGGYNYEYRPDPTPRDPLWETHPDSQADNYTPPTEEELKFYESLYENNNQGKRRRAVLLIAVYVGIMALAVFFGLLGVINIFGARPNTALALLFFGAAVVLIVMAQLEALIT